MGTESKSSERAPPEPREGARIIPFKMRASLRRRKYTPIMDPLRRIETEEDRRRMHQNVAAALVIALLLVSGIWLIQHLQTSARITVCLEAGHPNCLH